MNRSSLSVSTGSLNLWWMLPGLGLIGLLTGAVIRSLAISGWAAGLSVLPAVGTMAFVVSLVLVNWQRLHRWAAHMVSFLLAWVWIVQQVGPLLDERLISWRDQAAELVIRIIGWIRVLASGGRGEDIVLFVVALAFLSWWLVYATVWAVFRQRRPWLPVIANGTVFLVNYTYVLPKPDTEALVLIASALLLLVYHHVMQRRAAWEAQQISYPDLLPLRAMWAATVVGVVLILLTAFLPSTITSERAAQTWETLRIPFRMARAAWEDAFSTINAPPGAGSISFTARTAPLGGARSPGLDLVMTVRSSRLEYWRAVAFDRYDGSGWVNTTGELARSALGVATAEQARTPLAAGETLPVTDRRARRLITQTITLAQERNDDLLSFGGTPLQFSLPAQVEHLVGRDENGGITPIYDDVSLVTSLTPLGATTTYTVTALVSVADVQSLRNAGTDYPQWVRERYLQLPANLPARVRAEAARVIAAANAETPYDQAIAIQDYLRRLTYSEDIPPPPSNVDLVDWFLFEQQSGYCDYFASAMVVMLRSVGVPARWVRGYASGDYDPEQGVYLVRENVAHSWPEVYFPGIGWERFEPTAASYTSLPERPLQSAFGEEEEGVAGSFGGTVPDPGRFEELEDDLTASGVNSGAASSTAANNPSAAGSSLLTGWFSVVLVILMGIGLIMLSVRLWLARELRGLRLSAAAYAEMGWLANIAGLPQQPSETPSEYAQRLANLFPEHATTIHGIATAYIAERYRRGAVTRVPTEDRRQALRRALTRYAIQTAFQRLWLPLRRGDRVGAGSKPAR
ncbi:transglutaminaseTgpA domain-containing protein [Chloroflexus sp.]|uniref:transglutaminase TgpA family protein n=1 Tax=Chloroflexus sp. TaxID=1904827 RepID=UPI00257F143D|nr:transglutaminaseTgpA domain-containing protein [Chloroflexus sp.]